MARRAVTQYFDDLDGKALQETDVNIVEFGYEGTDYTIDLSAANAKKFADALAPYLKVASKKTAAKKNDAARINKQRNREIRAWAEKKGLDVPARGRLSAEIVDQYNAEQAK